MAKKLYAFVVVELRGGTCIHIPCANSAAAIKQLDDLYVEAIDGVIKITGTSELADPAEDHALRPFVVPMANVGLITTADLSALPPAKKA